MNSKFLEFYHMLFLQTPESTNRPVSGFAFMVSRGHTAHLQHLAYFVAHRSVGLSSCDARLFIEVANLAEQLHPKSVPQGGKINNESLSNTKTTKPISDISAWPILFEGGEFMATFLNLRRRPICRFQKTSTSDERLLKLKVT